MTREIMEGFEKDLRFLLKGVRPPDWVMDEQQQDVWEQIREMLANPTRERVNVFFDSLIFNEMPEEFYYNAMDYEGNLYREFINDCLDAMVERLKILNLENH